jgi:hypothetical protein
MRLQEYRIHLKQTAIRRRWAYHLSRLMVSPKAKPMVKFVCLREIHSSTFITIANDRQWTYSCTKAQSPRIVGDYCASTDLLRRSYYTRYCVYGGQNGIIRQMLFSINLRYRFSNGRRWLWRSCLPTETLYLKLKIIYVEFTSYSIRYMYIPLTV